MSSADLLGPAAKLRVRQDRAVSMLLGSAQARSLVTTWRDLLAEHMRSQGFSCDSPEDAGAPQDFGSTRLIAATTRLRDPTRARPLVLQTLLSADLAQFGLTRCEARVLPDTEELDQPPDTATTVLRLSLFETAAFAPPAPETDVATMAELHRDLFEALRLAANAACIPAMVLPSQFRAALVDALAP